MHKTIKMVLSKYDSAHNECFIVPIRGLYLEHKISVEDFKDRNAGLMKNRQIETVASDKGDKIYKLFDLDTDGELVKESLQEWLCDNRLEVTQCISIALGNHELSYAGWFKYVDDKSGPDELALYSLSRKYGIHTSVYNKSYVWTTLMNHMSRSDDEIFRLSGVNLVYLGEMTYGIIREIHAPQLDVINPAPKPHGHLSKKSGKVTCRDSSRGRKSSNRGKNSKNSGNRGMRPQSLSESRRTNYGITSTNVTTRSVRSSRRKIDYVSLNDGYDDEDSTPAKKCHKESYRPRSAPSATRMSTHKRMNSPETPAAEELSAVPSTSNDTPLSGVSTTDNTLPDLVVNQPQNVSLLPTADLNVQQQPLAMNTLEDLEAASTLLSLGDTLEETLEDDDDNALLMPIGGTNNPEDVVPQPLRLDQLSVNNAIAGIVDAEQTKKDEEQAKNTMTKVPVEQPDTVNVPDDPLPEGKPDVDTTTTKKGSLKTKSYVLKKRPDTKRSFRCSECNVVKSTVQELNAHHHRCHNPQMCGICNRTFALASSLTRHMYEHDEKWFQCDSCDYSSHFASELETHKIVHRKTPTHKCMHANCDKWFLQKWDFTLHLQKHDG